MSDNKIYAVTGKPVLHSMSPVIFKAAFKAHKTTAPYLRLCGRDAAHALSLAKRTGVRGFNVTSPFKEKMSELVDTLSPDADKLKAVNTVVLIDGKAHGHNTDPLGVKLMLEMGQAEVLEKKAVVLGAGGASKAAVHALFSLNAKDIVVINRSVSRAKELSVAMGCRVVPWDRAEAELVTTDIVISCLPRSARTELPFPWDQLNCKIFDANYHTLSAPEKSSSEAIIAGGREWLVGQGARAFEILTGKQAPENKMFAAFDSAQGKTVNWNKVVLLGLPGSGKSTVGKVLASKLGCRFSDTDDMIVRSSGLTIPNIFEKYNEAFFRKLEKEAVSKALSKDGGWVVALGGGAVETEENRQSLGNSGAVAIWLWSSPQSSASRIPPGTRPLLSSKDPHGDIAKLLNKRRMDYASTASLVVDTENLTPNQICDTIFFELGSVRKD